MKKDYPASNKVRLSEKREAFVRKVAKSAEKEGLTGLVMPEGLLLYDKRLEQAALEELAGRIAERLGLSCSSKEKAEMAEAVPDRNYAQGFDSCQVGVEERMILFADLS